MTKKDIPNTTVITPFGHFKFTSMLFGSRNASQTFQRFINVFQGMDIVTLFCYVDDILVASKIPEQHQTPLHFVFEKLQTVGSQINTAKCFGVEEVNFLGYTISQQEVRTMKDKVMAVMQYKKPQNILDILELRRNAELLSPVHSSGSARYLINACGTARKATH